MSDNATRGTARAADIVIVAAALAMVGMYAMDRRTVAGSRPSPTKAPESWANEIQTGISIGPENAKLTMIEFMDFECPFCAQWNLRVDSLRAEYPSDVRVILHHLPLRNHANAIPAAVAVECASRQNVTEAYVREVFSAQARLAEKPWADLAASAAVPDLTMFSLCIQMPVDSFPRIKYGLDLAERSSINSTPTVWIDGEVQRPRPTLADLRARVGRR